jgi:hypothetical protein
MLNKNNRYQLVISDTIKKIMLVTAAAMLFFAVAAAEEVQGTIVPGKYSFKLYVLAKGVMKKNTARPDFGWRIIKAFPLKVKEFTYPAPYMDYNAQEFKVAAGNILESITEVRRKNAVRVADAVFDYINTSITDRQVTDETTDNPHKVYYSALQSLKAGTGNNLEKCRLAVAMLRYFFIPARIVTRAGGYEVEYYIQPLAEKGKGAWHLYGFNGNSPAAESFFEPADWHPVDAAELLREEWKSPMFIKLIEQKRTYIGADDAEAQAVFMALTATGKPVDEAVKPEKGGFQVIDELSYELWLNPGTQETVAEFTLPFNIPDDFKTIKYAAVTGDKRLSVKSKWPQTKTKPSQEGIIYILPVKFLVNILPEKP